MLSRTRKLFTSSLDSTIKCWTFHDRNITSNFDNNSVASPNAPAHPSDAQAFSREPRHVQQIS